MPEHGIDAKYDVTVTFKDTEVNILLLTVLISPVVDEILKSVPE